MKKQFHVFFDSEGEPSLWLTKDGREVWRHFRKLWVESDREFNDAFTLRGSLQTFQEKCWMSGPHVINQL